LGDLHFGVWEMKSKVRKTFSTPQNANRSNIEQMARKITLIREHLISFRTIAPDTGIWFLSVRHLKAAGKAAR